MALTRPDVSQIADGDRTLAARLADYVSVKDSGAVGDGVTDDTAAIQAAFAAAEAAGIKRLVFPPGNYLASGTLATIDDSDWEIAGAGKTLTRITNTADGDLFKIDVSAAHLYRIVVRDMEITNTHATGLNATGVRVVATTASATGLKHATFENIRFRGVGLAGIYYEATGKVDDGAGSLTIEAHAFCNHLNLEFPQYTRYPINCVRFQEGNGAHHLFLGGQYRADATAGYGIQAGTGGAGISVGDLIINGVHFVIGKAGVNLAGPSDDKYRNSVCIVGCQFDVMTTNTMVLSRLKAFHVFGNNYQVGVPASLTSLDFSESILEDKDHLYLRGAIVDTVASTASRVGLAPGAGTNNPRVYANSINTDQSLSVEGQGTGGVHVARNKANYLFLDGGAAASELVTIAAQGSDTNIALRIGGKGAKGVIVGDSATKTLGFYNSAGTTRQAIGAAATDAATTQALVNEIRTTLLNLGLVL